MLKFYQNETVKTLAAAVKSSDFAGAYPEALAHHEPRVAAVGLSRARQTYV
jgi:hypothetical protein